MPKKNNKRAKTKNSALRPELNLKTRYELISDYDYLDKLSEKEKTWLNKFTKEYVNADLNSKKPKANFHKSKQLKTDCYDRNNSRNRCIYTRSKAAGVIKYIEDMPKKSSLKDSHIEDLLICKIDLEKEKKVKKKT